MPIALKCGSKTFDTDSNTAIPHCLGTEFGISLGNRLYMGFVTTPDSENVIMTVIDQSLLAQLHRHMRAPFAASTVFVLGQS